RSFLSLCGGNIHRRKYRSNNPIRLLGGEQLMSMDAWKKYIHKDQIMRDVFYGFVSATRPNIICDVGSYNGDEAIRFKRLSPKSRVYAFEANRQNVEECI